MFTRWQAEMTRSRKPVPVVRCAQVILGAHGHNKGRVNGIVTAIVVGFDVIDVGRGHHAGNLCQL